MNNILFEKAGELFGYLYEEFQSWGELSMAMRPSVKEVVFYKLIVIDLDLHINRAIHIKDLDRMSPRMYADMIINQWNVIYRERIQIREEEKQLTKDLRKTVLELVNSDPEFRRELRKAWENGEFDWELSAKDLK